MRRIFCLLLVMCLVFSLAACGGSNGNDDPDPGEEINGENGGNDENGNNGDNEGIGSGEFYDFETILDLAGIFTELACTVMNTEADYFFLGPDTVNGVRAEHIRILASGDKIDVWLAEDETIVKGTVDDEEMPVESIQIAVEFYFSMLEVFIGDQGWDEDWADAEVTTVTRDLDAGNLEVTRLVWDPVWLPYDLEIELAEIAGAKMLIKFWQVTDSGQPMSGWYLRRAIPR